MAVDHRITGVNRVWVRWEDFARHMARRGRAVQPAMRDAGEIGAEILTRTAHHILETKVYSQQIPFRGAAGSKRAQGKPMWKRTRQLIDQDEFVSTVRGDIKHQNPTAWAQHRYNLGLEGHRAPVYTESVQWPDEAWELNKQVIRQIYRDHLRHAMERPEDFT